jgi:hypothetical protein
MIDTHYHDITAHGLQEAEERSIGTAMRATLCFIAIVLLLLWAGVSDAAGSGTPPPGPVAATRTG